MKLTVLGCWGAYPEAGEATSGYLLQTGRHTVLLDCGSGVLANLWKHVSHEQIDAAFISHFHHDHTADLGCLLYASKFAFAFKKRTQPLPVYASNQPRRFKELTFGEYSSGIEIKPDAVLDLDGLKISFAPTVHDAYNLAMRFEYAGKVLVYTGDLGPASDLSRFEGGADLLITESSLYAHETGLFQGHLTSTEAAALAKQLGAKALLLTHFPHIGETAKLADEASQCYAGKIYLAKTNLTVEF
ncbi:MAG: MBL fold metallo-hydrolase [Dehalobacter sp. 4CP]|uniref:MBL fold metallo-hydrolase n=1 Tax=Dehalobacter sp. CP TaxID=2594474 RepID=UPI0013CBC52F|nr:MBL fold metallo-hydrolase [Dehalobacter sp. 4CP]